MTPRPMLDLPVELVHTILSYLPNSDIKSLRLVSKQYCDSVQLRLSRVFLSANPLNIKIFRAVADHEEFRHHITEIIWDDARLSHSGNDIIHPEQGIWLPNTDISDNEIDEFNEEEDWDKGLEDLYFREEDYDRVHLVIRSRRFKRQRCPHWYKAACKQSLERTIERRSGSSLLPAECPSIQDLCEVGPSLGECWEYYRQLVKKQDDVLAGGYDEEAFVYGLEKFTALRRVTVTPSTHNLLFGPFYQTPMIRAFPPGFFYPIPFGWPTSLTEEPEDVPAFPWQAVDERQREKYRGFRIAIRALAQHKHDVVELSLDARLRFTGINCRIFEDPCPEYDNFVEVLKHPGFRRLDLPLIFGGTGSEPRWQSFRNGKLRAALSEAGDLEEFSFYTAGLDGYFEGDEPPISTVPVLLESMFPLDKWHKLRHFELSRFIVSQTNVISCLSKLPDTVVSVKLSLLVFIDGEYSWHVFLEEMRKQIQEKTLWPNSRPNVIIGTEKDMCGNGEVIWFEKEIHAFLYDDAENPFESPPDIGPKFKWGTWKDALDPYSV